MISKAKPVFTIGAGLAGLAFAGAAALAQGTAATKPITIGVIAEQSGALSANGSETGRAAVVIAEQLNRAGGILGRPVRLIVRDSKSTANEAVRQARDLIFTENVDFLMHSISSAECIGVGGVATQAKKIVFSNCGHDDFTGKDGSKYTFRIPNITGKTQALAAADYILQTLKPTGRRFYVIAQDFAFPRGSVANFKEYMKVKMPDIQWIGESWPKMAEPSYASFITALIEAKPDVIFYSFGVALPFFQQSASYELSKRFPMISSYWGGSDEIQRMTKEAVPYGALMGGYPWYAIEGKENEQFVKDYRAASNGAPPFTPAYFQHITMQALKLGIEKARTIDADPLIAALEGMKYESIIGPITIRAFDHQGVTPFWIGKAAWDDKLNLGVIRDVLKYDTGPYLPTEAEIKKARGQ